MKIQIATLFFKAGDAEPAYVASGKHEITEVHNALDHATHHEFFSLADYITFVTKTHLSSRYYGPLLWKGLDEPCSTPVVVMTGDLLEEEV